MVGYAPATLYYMESRGKLMNDLVVKSVDLFGDSVMAAKDRDGNIWAGVSYFCKALGMDKAQKDNQVERVQKDDVLKKGAGKFPAGVFDQNNETIVLRIDYVPIWLTKISITPKIKREKPELAEKLLQYQLKAKEILAAAFLPQYAQQNGDMQYTKADIPVGEVARLSTVMDRVMVRQNSKPHDIARAFEMLCGQFGIMLPDNFVNVPEYEQMTLANV